MAGRKVIHKTYGEGVITECREHDSRIYIEAVFPEDKSVKVVFPDSFVTALSPENEDLIGQICNDLVIDIYNKGQDIAEDSEVRG